MDFEAFDTVKFEMQEAIAMFNRFRKAMKVLHFLELLFPLVLIPSSWARVPAAVKISGEFVHELSVYLCNPHVVFLIGNAIIAALFVLCRRTQAGSSSVTSEEACDDDVRQGEIPQPIANCQVYAPPPKPEKTVAVGEEIKQIVYSERVIPKQQREEILVALQMATKQIQKFRRSQSEKQKRETALRSQRDLRRSETELRLKAVSSSARRTMTSVDTVEKLSNEEFRLRIEKFIRKNQEFFKLEIGREENQHA